MERITTIANEYTPPENSVVRNVDVDFGQGEYPSRIRLSQGDTMPIIAANLKFDGEKYTVPDGAAVNIRLRKNDNTVVYNPSIGVSADKSIAYFKVTNQMSAADGKAFAIVEVIKDAECIGTSNFDAIFEENPVPESTIESSSEFEVLVEYVAEAEDAAKRAETAASGASESERASMEHASKADTSAGTAAEHAQAAELAKEGVQAVAKDVADTKTAVEELERQAGEHASAASESAGAAAADALRAEEAADLAQRIAQGALGYYETPEILAEKHPSAEAGNWAIVGSTDTIWVWDSDTETWQDSGNKTDLSQYYTRTETDDLLTGLSEDLDANLANMVASVNSKTGAVTLSAGDVGAYTKAEVDTRVAAATSRGWDITVPASGWAAPGDPAPTWNGHTAKWATTIAASGMTAATAIRSAGISFVSGDRDAAGRWQWLVPGAGSITLYSDLTVAPAADFTISIMEVR